MLLIARLPRTELIEFGRTDNKIAISTRYGRWKYSYLLGRRRKKKTFRKVKGFSGRLRCGWWKLSVLLGENVLAHGRNQIIHHTCFFYPADCSDFFRYIL